MGLPAARVGDEVAHTNAMLGLLIGAAVGAALAVAVVATGGLAAVAAGAMIAGGLAGGALAGEYIGAASMGPPTGAITIGSPNVMVNGRPAAMTNIALAICAKEYGVPQPIAQGAATVFINGMPAARKNDKLVCSAQIIQGSSDVFYDDKTVQTLDISPEVPEWLNTTLQVVAVGALIVGFGAAVVAVGFGAATAGLVGGIVGGELGSMGGRALGQALGLSEAGQRAMEVGGGFLGGLLGGTAATKAYEGFGTNPEGVPTPGSREVCTNGCPISMHTGEELLTLEDFTWQGPLALVWRRFYRTAQIGCDLQLGHGWLTPLDEWIELRPDGGLEYHDREGRRIALPLPEVGGHGVNVAERLRVERTATHLRVRGEHEPDRLFELGPGRRPLSAWRRAGHQIDIERDAEGRATVLRASWGKALLVERAGHRIAALVPARATPSGLEPAGPPHVRYSYDAAGDLVGASDALDQGERYAYARHLVTRRTLATGFSFRYEWDGEGPGARCSRNWGDEGIYDYRFEWQPERGWSRAIDSRGGMTDYVHDAGGRLMRITSPEGLTRTLRYDERGLLAEVAGPLGTLVAHVHDDEGRVVEVRDAAGAVHGLAYDARGRLAAVRDPLGHETRWQYDDEGRLLRVIDAAGGVTTWRYNPQGLLAQTTNPVGQVRLLWWDEQARLVAEVGFDGRRRYFHHDAADRIDAVTTQEKRTRRFEWDPVGRMVAHTNEVGEQVRLRYNARGRLTHWTDPQGHTTEYRYREGLSQPSERIDPLGRVLRYHYDTERHLVALTNPKGERYQLAWDLDGRLVGQVGFDGRTRRYDYDAAGRLAAKAEAVGWDGESPRWRVTRFERDPIGRLLAKAFPDGTEHRFEYDATGALLAASTDEHEVRFAYDVLGRVRQEQQGERVVEHRRDALGRRVATRLPDGQVLGYGWSRFGRVEEVTLDGRPLSRHRWNEFAQEAERDQGALTTRFDYDPAGRLATQSVTDAERTHVVIGRDYRRDAAGRIAAIDDLRQGPSRYVYDPAGQLLEAHGVTPERFVHDPAGNLFVDGPGVAEGDRLLMQGDRHYRYDAAGNRIEERRGTGGRLVTRYEYDDAQRLVAAHTPKGRTRYRYDALGRRIGKATPEGETLFVWDGAVLLGELAGDGDAFSRWYVYEPASYRPLACVQRSARTSRARVAAAAGEPAAPARSAVYHYHLDHLGTPREMTDADGRIVWSGRYRAWGALALADVDEIDNPLRLQGQYEDAETGLHYNFQRYYDPRSGRFVTQDPIGLMGGDNVYAWASEPVDWIDPLGLNPALLSQLGDDANSVGVYRFTDKTGKTYVGSTTDQDFSARLSQHMASGKLPPENVGTVQTYNMDGMSEQQIYDVEASEIVRNGGRAGDGGTTSNLRAPPGTRDNFHDEQWLESERTQPSRFGAPPGDCG